MDTTDDSSITLVENYTENSINEKNLGTQYIYTTEGQLIPASNTAEIQLNDQQFNEPVIEQVDYQYQITTEEVPVTTASNFEVIQQPSSFIIQQIETEPDKDVEQELLETTGESEKDVVQEIIEASADGSDKIEVVTEADDTVMEIVEQEGEISELYSDPLAPELPCEVEPKSSKPRGRKQTEDVPHHILGHDFSNPQDSVNGNTPRPRLGVKVPYRTLSSQIVSKEVIENEIIERGKKKQQEKEEQEQFAQSLTSRFVNTVSGGGKDIDTNGNEELKSKAQDAIDNNSDLLAILEGDSVEEDDLMSSPSNNKQSTPTDETNLKNLEREIALQQLQELPYLVPKLVKTSKTLKVTTPLKTYARKRKSSEGVNAEPVATPTKPKPQSEPIYITKSSRIIKKKVIWDPDEPLPSPIKKPKSETTKVEKELKVEVKKDAKVEKKVMASPKVVKKPRSELDRLLGDEGAIKMLYDLKQEGSPEEKRKSKVLSVERTFKELAKKANQIKTDLAKDTSTAETPKMLRKKESISPTKAQNGGPGPVSRQKSKDSIRSTPPPSPGFLPNELSCLIRRRSSSSIESGEELDDSEERLGKKNARDDPSKKRAKKLSESSTKSQKNRPGNYATFAIKKSGKSVTIELNTSKSSGGYLTKDVLTELTVCLNKLSKEKDCLVVLIKSSNAAVFSLGLDYRALVADKDTTRRLLATELASKVCEFLKCLAQFSKCLVAAVQGECVGVACTMLPLFDLVIAVDDAKFRCDYVQLGVVAEAGFLLSSPYGLAGDLLYANQTLPADDACRRGLVSRLCWPEKYQEIIRSTVSAIAQGSRQSLETTKKQLYNYGPQSRKQLMSNLDSMLPDLIQSWTSSECQLNFAQL